mgnify:CR=1 FL=1
MVDNEEDEFEFLNPITFERGTQNTCQGEETGEPSSTINYNDICFKDTGDNIVYAMEFDTVKDAETVYLLYGRSTGFSI